MKRKKEKRKSKKNPKFLVAIEKVKRKLLTCFLGEFAGISNFDAYEYEIEINNI